MKGGNKTHLRSAPKSEMALCGLMSPYGLCFAGDRYLKNRYPTCKNCQALSRAHAIDNLSPDPRGGEDWYIGTKW